MIKPEIRLIIPCYNECENLKNLLAEIALLKNKRLRPLVLDDGSTDDTSKVANSYDFVDLIRLPFNLGIGNAVQTGLKFSAIQKDNFALKLDGDGQHPPESISELITELEKSNADIVIGSRFKDNHEGFQSTLFRRLGIKIIQIMCKILTGQWLSDPTSGFRAYNRKAIEFMAEHYPSFDYPEPEEIVLARKNGLRICEVPVKMRNRKHGVSTISSSISIYYMLKVTLSMLFIALREPETRKK